MPRAQNREFVQGEWLAVPMIWMQEIVLGEPEIRRGRVGTKMGAALLQRRRWRPSYPLCSSGTSAELDCVMFPARSVATTSQYFMHHEIRLGHWRHCLETSAHRLPQD